MVEVKPGMKSRFVDSGELCREFPYRAKALFAFEEVDGTDICFFGMHVQVSHIDIAKMNILKAYNCRKRVARCTTCLIFESFFVIVYYLQIHGKIIMGHKQQ